MLRHSLIVGVLTLWAASGWAHEHLPPHQGSLQVFGKEVAHLEIVLDPAAGKVTAYALDGEAERYERLAQRTVVIHVLKSRPARPAFDVVLRAVANPLTGEVVGNTSQFEGVSPKLRGLEALEGRFGPVTVRGLRFASNRLRYPEGNE